MQSYVMLVGGRFRGQPQKVVIELHTLHVIGSQIENAVTEGKLQYTHFISCSHITILMSMAFSSEVFASCTGSVVCGLQDLQQHCYESSFWLALTT